MDMLRLRPILMSKLKHQPWINRNTGSKPKSMLDPRADASGCVKAGDNLMVVSDVMWVNISIHRM